MRKVVVDTNVLVSHLFGGNPRDVVLLWYEGHFDLCVTDGIIAEYSEVLSRFGEVSDEARRLLSSITEAPNVRLVCPRERFIAVQADPSDDMFLECAVAAQADVIVSGDGHLLELGSFRGIPIVGPAEFLLAFRG